jgi:hypothetical protein
MSLEFLDDAAFDRERQSIKLTALCGNERIECLVTPSALEALGCSPCGSEAATLETFKARRIDCEIAALVKFRRATRKPHILDISAADL